MKLTKYSINEFEQVASEYNIAEYRVEKVTLGGDFFITFLLFNSTDELKSNWQKLSSVLSEYLEECMVDDFSRWNFYIIYACKETVTKELQYKIENNAFFARKIVEKMYSFQLTDKNVRDLIIKHVNFNNLKINANKPSQNNYVSSSLVYEKLKETNISSEEQVDEILRSLEEKIDEI